MKLDIVYTPGAETTASGIYNFISGKFGVKAADKFIIKAGKTITLIAANLLCLKLLQSIIV